MNAVGMLSERAEWLEARRTGVGASELAAILGVDERRGSLSIYARKVAPLSDEDENDEDDPRYWGRAFEEPVAQWYAQRTARVVTNAGAFDLRRHPDSRLFATLDRDVVDPTREAAGEAGALECKAVSVWGPLDQWRQEPPLCYQVQLQAQLAVTGRRWGSIAAVLGGAKPVYFDFERNDRFIEAALRAVEVFWSRVERRDPPPPDGTREAAEAVKQLWPEDSGRTIVLPAEAFELVEEFEIARDEESEAKDRYETVKTAVRFAMQDATWALLPDGRKFQLKTEPRREHVVQASRPRVLRLLKK